MTLTVEQSLFLNVPFQDEIKVSPSEALPLELIIKILSFVGDISNKKNCRRVDRSFCLGISEWVRKETTRIQSLDSIRLTLLRKKYLQWTRNDFITDSLQLKKLNYLKLIKPNLSIKEINNLLLNCPNLKNLCIHSAHLNDAMLLSSKFLKVAPF